MLLASAPHVSAYYTMQHQRMYPLTSDRLHGRSSGHRLALVHTFSDCCRCPTQATVFVSVSTSPP